MTTAGFTQTAGYYTTDSTLPADYCIGNFDVKGVVQSYVRARSNLFAVGEAQTFKLYGGPFAGHTYEVRDYDGTVVASGSAGPGSPAITVLTVSPATALLTLSPPLPPGGYRLFLRSATSISRWLTARGGAAFVVFRNTAGFHANPVASPGGSGEFSGCHSDDGEEASMRGVMLFSPLRMAIQNAATPTVSTGGPTTKTIIGVQADIVLQNTWYSPYDTARPKPKIVAFPNYNSLAGEDAGVTQVVNAVKADVRYFEGRNEPDGQGATTWIPKQQAFFNAVKAADPTAKVLGPCPTGLSGPAASGVYAFLKGFLDGGGASYIDALSFHDYNNIWGDLVLARQVYDRLMTLLAAHGLTNIEKWMTEIGAGAANFGVYSPHLQARFTMLSLQVWEQYGIPKERVCYFYDSSHGFDSVPTWHMAFEITFYPLVALIRVWSEELFGKTYAERYGFGSTDENFTIGSRFAGADGTSVAAFSSCGRTDHQLTLNVTGSPASLVVVTPFGIESTVPVVANQITVSLKNGIPTYVRLPAGVSLRTIARQYGPDLCRDKTVTVSGSGAGASKVTDGVLRSWYFGQEGAFIGGASGPFCDDSASLPAWLVVDFGTATTIDTVHVHCPPPYAFQGTLLDYDLQRWNGSTWVTIETIIEPAFTLEEATDRNFHMCQVESYASERSVFVHEFAPVSTTKIRLWVRDCTRGAYPDQLTSDVRGENWAHVMQVRAVQAFNRSGLPALRYGARVA